MTQQEKIDEIFKYVKSSKDDLYRVYEWMGKDACSAVLTGTRMLPDPPQGLSIEAAIVACNIQYLNNRVYRLENPS